MRKLFLLLLLIPLISKPPLSHHFAVQSAVTSFRIQSSSSGRGTTTTTEVQLKNNHFYLKTANLILIDNTAYLASPSGTWAIQVLSPQEITSYQRFHPDQVKANLAKSAKTAQFTSQGRQPCGSLTCYKYQEIDPAYPEAIRTFWFDTKAYLLRKDIFSFGEFTSENTYSYDDIDIQIPS